MMRVGSLFAGIGGLDLGLERAGMQVDWQVEIDPYAQRVLAKHWPNARRHDDIKTFLPSDPSEWQVDLLCGGFPCQDISLAGKGAGLAGERSGLFFEAIRVASLLRPRYLLLENVPALLARGMGGVLGALAKIGYDAEWDCLPAAAFGAPHIRERLFILAYPNGLQGGERRDPSKQRGRAEETQQARVGDRGIPIDASNPDGIRLQKRGDDARRQGEAGPVIPRREVKQSTWWDTEPNVVRVVHGVPSRVDRIRGLGNAVVPQVAEWLGRRIDAHMDPKD